MYLLYCILYTTVYCYERSSFLLYYYYYYFVFLGDRIVNGNSCAETTVQRKDCPRQFGGGPGIRCRVTRHVVAARNTYTTNMVSGAVTVFRSRYAGQTSLWGPQNCVRNALSDMKCILWHTNYEQSVSIKCSALNVLWELVFLTVCVTLYNVLFFFFIRTYFNLIIVI